MHVSVIDVELREDYNSLLKPGSLGQINEVHIDNTKIDNTMITVLITNKGPSPSSYRLRITDCPQGLPPSWFNVEKETKTISPHHDHKIILNLYGKLPLEEFSCSAILMNRYDQLVARRRINVRKGNSCSCVKNSDCTCTDKSDTRFKPAQVKDYHVARLEEKKPTSNKIPEEPKVWPTIWPGVMTISWHNVMTIVCSVLTILLLFLLLLGFFKWMFGLCVPTVSRWGLDTLINTEKMERYYEKDLRSRSVVFNELGQPVHPDTCQKSVRVCNRISEFILNVSFFFVYPFMALFQPRAKPQPPSHQISTTSTTNTTTSTKESKASLLSEKEESSTMIRVITYGDTINSKMEEEDTKYVIDELKKSQESLQNLNRYKREHTVRQQSSSD
ncbi:hypothetical protein APICC_09928 [Apis cerana cerana]|uniref:Uncharacterized protein n=1 Tax=Apis cerana cerana TaxID=94128 RepID=A0A2A3EQT9_APICC|nr:hypothetical protein APICC_09928 [Apis cerana cerana]